MKTANQLYKNAKLTGQTNVAFKDWIKAKTDEYNALADKSKSLTEWEEENQKKGLSSKSADFDEPVSVKKKPISNTLLIGGIVVLVGVAAYAGWQLYKMSKNKTK